MKILSWNVNGLRAVYKNLSLPSKALLSQGSKRNFLGWLKKSKADIVCLQEIRASKEQLPSDIAEPKGYFAYLNSAQRKGYSGTAVFTKEKPKKVETSLGLKKFDDEGRIIKLTYKNFILVNLYLPHGGRQKGNLGYKLKVYQKLLIFLNKNKNKKLILTGDFNIAHQEIDLARPNQNKNNTMFTPKERKQIDKIIDLGFADTFRKFYKEKGNYTWWPYFANARERNLGWRIDYIFVSQSLESKLNKAFIFPEVKGSDHCPVGIEIEI